MREIDRVQDATVTAMLERKVPQIDKMRNGLGAGLILGESSKLDERLTKRCKAFQNVALPANEPTSPPRQATPPEQAHLRASERNVATS